MKDQKLYDRDIVGKTVNQNRDAMRQNIRQEIRLPEN